MACGKSGGPVDDEWHPDTVLEEMLLVEQPVLTQHIAVIGGHHNHGVLKQSCVLKRTDEATHHIVKIRDISEIAMSCCPDVFVGDTAVNQNSVVQHAGGMHPTSLFRLKRCIRQADLVMAITVPVLLESVVRLVWMGKRGNQEKGCIIHPSKIMQFGFCTIKNCFIVIDLNATFAHAGADHTAGVIVGVHTKFFPTGCPGKISGIKLRHQPLFKSMQHVRTNKVLFSRKARPVSRDPEIVSHRGNVGGKFRAVVVSADLAGQHTGEH